MTIRELKEAIQSLPEDSIVTYRHNKYGKIDIDSVVFTEEQTPTGNVIKFITFEASFEED